MELLDNLSTRERNLWSELLVDIVVGLYYFPTMIRMMGGGDEALTGKAMGELVTSTVMLAIVVGGIIAIFLHTQKKPEVEDERDHQFDARGSRIAYRVLALCVALMMGNVLVWELMSEAAQTRSWLQLTPILLANLMLLSLYLSSLVKTVIQLFYYRRGY